MINVKSIIDRFSIGPGESVKVRWTRDTGELLYPNSDRTRYRDDYAILMRSQDEKDGLHIFVRKGSKVKVHNLRSKNADQS